ncbi:hypothetical protein GCM10011521_22990 [Arenimonas soli]|uniref:RcnB family protein n=2 Tax=Arenimonas soli TaxID=2269504 RepID=A0ABQ1HN65_9GAMM|nr:hypothetical protein GCM10011521_22990 [Arenimonas soli]
MVSMAVLLAGATVMPAVAQDVRARVVAGASAQDNKGPVRVDRREDRRDDRRGNRDDRRDDRRDWRADRRDDRNDRRDGRRDDRNHRRDDRRDDRRDWRHDNRNDPRYVRQGRHDNRNYVRHDNRHYVRHDDRRWRGYQWRPEHRFRAPARYVYPSGHRYVRWGVGHRMPPAYYGRPYYVDYNRYRLPPPPYGHRWVRSDRDVVLVALATGLVLDVLYDLYY